MTELASATALEILALVDEYPSEPFSLDRKWLLEKLEQKLVLAWGAFEEEAQENFQAGYHVGFEEGSQQAQEDADREIEELKDKVAELETELEDVQDKIAEAFAEGLEAGHRDGDNVASIEIR